DEQGDAQKDEHKLRESGHEQGFPGPDVAAAVRSEHDCEEQDAVGRRVGGGGAADPTQGRCEARIAASDFGHPGTTDGVVVARSVRVPRRNQAEEYSPSCGEGVEIQLSFLHTTLRIFFYFPHPLAHSIKTPSSLSPAGVEKKKKPPLQPKRRVKRSR